MIPKNINLIYIKGNIWWNDSIAKIDVDKLGKIVKTIRIITLINFATVMIISMYIGNALDISAKPVNGHYYLMLDGIRRETSYFVYYLIQYHEASALFITSPLWLLTELVWFFVKIFSKGHNSKRKRK